ncbi:hypothetical protein [Streptomyces sp. NPDC014734]|uniref:hypothetical protein n=1 Tax=Streptomyces sp. NPDC014734 TaxID=3364886 RepID=UPI0036F99D4D
MDHSEKIEKIDQDDIVRARNVLLASGRRTPWEEVDAYRVLARVGPASYLPRLAVALRRLSHDPAYGERHEDRLALCEEAVAAARAIDPAEPTRADYLFEALDACQREQYALGRRAEGLAMRAEMLAIGRAQAARAGTTAIKGLSGWAAGLSEEGRHAEAADALTELVAALLPDGPVCGGLAWSLLEWIAALDGAGRADEALAAFQTLVDMEADEARNDRGSMACHLHSLIGYARMLDSHDRAERAAAVRQEALALLAELASTGECRTWSGYQRSFWGALLSLSGADGGRPSPGTPHPPSGTTPQDWSPDARRRYVDSLGTLREEVDALAPRAAEDPDRHLAELVRLHRALTVRSAVWGEFRGCFFEERVRPLFDDGVGLARRLCERHPAGGSRTLAEALIDRSAFRVAVGEFGSALDDFRRALDHLVPQQQTRAPGETG